MPANGLLYAPPDACGCFLSVKEPGFIAIGPRRKVTEPMYRIEKGLAYGKKRQNSDSGPQDSWPMYRHDPARSGVGTTSLPGEIKKRWSAKIGGALTQPVIAHGLVYVAEIDSHALHAFTTKDGKRSWSFTAGGRIDSAPTIHNGTILFGSTDGWVTCLDAHTGELAWRALVAPAEQLACAYGQLESVWPVHGAVLVQNGSVYAAAGRSSYMDGGIRIVRLDPESGKQLSSATLYHIDDSIDRQQVKESGFNMEGTTRDILSGDGEVVYLKYFAFDKEGKRTTEGLKPHLFSITSILGEDWFVRSYWTISDKIEGAGWGGWANTHNRHPSGRILAFNDDKVYGYGRVKTASGPVGHKAEAVHLFCRDRNLPATPAAKKPPQQTGKKRRGQPPVPVKMIWSDTDALIVRAMAVGKERMAVAGARNIAKKADGEFAFSNDAEALAAYRGDLGAFVQVRSASDGRTLCEKKLGGMPVHDGLSVAESCIFVALRNGTIECWGE